MVRTIFLSSHLSPSFLLGLASKLCSGFLVNQSNPSSFKKFLMLVTSSKILDLLTNIIVESARNLPNVWLQQSIWQGTTSEWYRPINTANESVILQNDIDKLTSWAKTWQMQFNVSKCHTMRISRKKESILTDYYMMARSCHHWKTILIWVLHRVTLTKDLRRNCRIEKIVSQTH